MEVPVVYDGADVDELARLWDVSTAEVAARHADTEFEVAFCGFAPGFAYLRGLDADVPRRSSPRPRVPAGSVALAGRYCGIYPTESPGGWQLVGRTSAQLFDPGREPPALLAPARGCASSRWTSCRRRRTRHRHRHRRPARRPAR